MGAANEVHIVLLQEARYNVWSEGETDTTVVLAPPSDVLVGIGPQEVAEETAVRDLDLSIRRSQTDQKKGLREADVVTYISGTHHAPDLLHRVQVRA
jgi:hypothetical protein